MPVSISESGVGLSRPAEFKFLFHGQGLTVTKSLGWPSGSSRSADLGSVDLIRAAAAAAAAAIDRRNTTTAPSLFPSLSCGPIRRMLGPIRLTRAAARPPRDGPTRASHRA